MTTPSPDRQVEPDDSGLGGDEPFCQHGNLLWSEECDECVVEMQALSDAMANAVKESQR